MKENKKYIIHTYGTVEDEKVFECIKSASNGCALQNTYAVSFIDKPSGRRIVLDITAREKSVRINAYYEDELLKELGGVDYGR